MTESSSVPILECRGVKAFGAVQAVNKVNWRIYPGEVTALVGDNGAGKSTLIKLIAGALVRDEGEFYVKGQLADINTPQDAFRYGIATIYQDLALVETRDVVMNMFTSLKYSPIGSGMMESGCKQLIIARARQAGMSWSPQGLQPVLMLRAELLSGRWDQAWSLTRPRAA